MLTIQLFLEHIKNQNNFDMFFECSELWHLTINYDKILSMMFGTLIDYNLGGHKIDIYTNSKKS